MEQPTNKELGSGNQSKQAIMELRFDQKTIKLDTRVWASLKNMKKENETFNDVIKRLINNQTTSFSNGQISLIKYARKSLFLAADYKNSGIGIEFEYNDSKSQQRDFTLDLRLNKIFFGKKAFNPSIFFGVDSAHKHLNKVYLNLYFKCLALALEKEFRVSKIMVWDEDFERIHKWRKIYYDYNLSEDSFIRDIEDPLRLSEEEKADGEVRNNIINSISASIWKEIL